jgi:hypothetical protein
MGEGPTVRLYEKGDEVEIVPLLVSVFGRWPNFDIKCSPLEHWMWKYFDNPYNMMSTSVSVDCNKIVGVDGAIFQKVKLFNDTVLAAQGVDNAVDPGYRRIGLSKRMYELSKNNIWRKGAH